MKKFSTLVSVVTLLAFCFQVCIRQAAEVAAFQMSSTAESEDSAKTEDTEAVEANSGPDPGILAAIWAIALAVAIETGDWLLSFYGALILSLFLGWVPDDDDPPPPVDGETLTVSINPDGSTLDTSYPAGSGGQRILCEFDAEAGGDPVQLKEFSATLVHGSFSSGTGYFMSRSVPNDQNAGIVVQGVPSQNGSTLTFKWSTPFTLLPGETMRLQFRTTELQNGMLWITPKSAVVTIPDGGDIPTFTKVQDIAWNVPQGTKAKTPGLFDQAVSAIRHFMTAE